MIQRELGPWSFSCDPEKTRSLYAKVDSRGAKECDCLACRNFLLAWSQANPVEVTSLLQRLGIDPEHEAEVIHYGEYGEDPSFYSWWYHFVGEVDEDSAYARPALKSHGYELTRHVSVTLSNKVSLAWPGFEEFPLVQLELYAHLPWLAGKPKS